MGFPELWDRRSSRQIKCRCTQSMPPHPWCQPPDSGCLKRHDGQGFLPVNTESLEALQPPSDAEQPQPLTANRAGRPHQARPQALSRYQLWNLLLLAPHTGHGNASCTGCGWRAVRSGAASVKLIYWSYGPGQRDAGRCGVLQGNIVLEDARIGLQTKTHAQASTQECKTI